jgi:hypothetical protein
VWVMSRPFSEVSLRLAYVFWFKLLSNHGLLKYGDICCRK